MSADDGDSRSAIGVAAVAAAFVFLAYLLATRDPDAHERAAETLRAETHAQYVAFCARFGRSDDPDDQSRCVGGLWALHAWENERRAAIMPDDLP